MYAITVNEPGGPEAMQWTEVPDPRAGPGEVVVDVVASAVNRADLMQRQGNYPPPPGASEVLGLECSGRVAALGEGVTGWRIGDEVCALLSGGGYAERVAVPAAQLLPVPDGVDLVTAGGLPEVACTVWSNVVAAGRLAAGETLLVQGGSSGIGTHAIQVAKALGARVAATAGAPDRLERCRRLGADIVIDYHDDVPAELMKATDGHGADVILDNMGAKGLAANIDALAPDGRLVIIGLQGGVKGELNLAKLLGKRGSVTAMGMRGRPVDGPNGKGQIVAGVRGQVWPMIAGGRVRPIVHGSVPMSDAASAHRLLEAGGVIGKLLLVLEAPGVREQDGTREAMMGSMSQGNEDAAENGEQQVIVVGPDGRPVGMARVPQGGSEEGEGQPEGIGAMVDEPAKVMRIGTMIKQLLEEVRAAPLDEASRARLKEIHENSIKELEQGLAPDLRDELHRLSLPFTEDVTPSDSELRIAQAQLVGWLEGLFHGIQTALFAQQMAARAQLEQMRKGLPPGAGGQQTPGGMPEGLGRGTGQYL